MLKLFTTVGGEATPDYLKTYGNIKGGGTEVALFVIGLVVQFGKRRYRAFAYWFLAFALAVGPSPSPIWLWLVPISRSHPRHTTTLPKPGVRRRRVHTSS